ncbi:hypothetical protein vseg_019383 [Gypsophila vaccaria]
MFSPRLSPSSPSPSSSSSSSSRRLTRAKQLRHLRDCDVKELDSFLNSPTRHPHHGGAQPLPLPDLSALLSDADRLIKEKRKSKLKPPNSDCFRLPSPTGATKERYRVGEKSPARSACQGVPQDGKRSIDALQKVDAPCRLDPQRSAPIPASIVDGDQAQKNLRIDINFGSAPPSINSSPMVSPQRILNGDLFSSYHEEPNRWSEPPMPSGFPYTMRTESSGVSSSRHNSAFHSLSVKALKPSRKSTSGPASPRHPKSNIEISCFHNDNNFVMNVHPLPLPPTPSSSAQPSPLPQGSTRSEYLPVKNQWIKGKLIGRGTFGSVYVATNRETGALCAMKEVELCADDPKALECMRQLEQEIKVLSHLQHPNIVQYYGSEIVDDRFYIYLEYVYPGSINKYVHEHCGAITEAVVRNFTRHICSGLAYLHGRKTIHRDIKGANLLVDLSGVVKLADFGMAKHLTGQAADLSLKGSPNWMAPELMQSVLQKDNRSDLAFAVDIWSLGCTVIEMLTGKPPWSGYEGAAAMFKVLKESPPIPENLSPEGKDFLNCCFRRNPADRPPASKLLEHSFLKNYQHLDILTLSPAPNFPKQTDKTLSPKEMHHQKCDKVLMSPDRRMRNGKGGMSENGVLSHHETNDKTKAPRHSPRSILDPATSLSPPCSGPAPKLLVSPNAFYSFTV